MDGTRFDSLTRSLTTAASRRRALVAILGGALGLLGWQRGEEAAAHDPSKACKKKSGQQKKKCLKKAKKHNATHAIAPPSPPPPAPPPTCAEQCPSTCGACFDRKGGGPPLCGDDATFSNCTADSCTSDADCVGKTGPDCVTGYTVRETGTSYVSCGGSGVCTSIRAC